MSEQIITTSKAWLSAKDNWLGEGMFRPTTEEKLAPREQPAAEPPRQLAPQPYAEVYFAHG